MPKDRHLMPYVTDMTSSEMIDATRLTREGRLAEATALLQRSLRSKAAVNTAAHAASDGAHRADPSPRLLEVNPVDGRVEEADPASHAPHGRRQGHRVQFTGRPAGMAQKPKRRALHGLFGELKQGNLDGESPAHKARSGARWRAVHGGYV